MSFQPSPNGADRSGDHWHSSAWQNTSLALDLFKTIAALLMVLNHSGYAILSKASSQAGITGGITFLGSVAPALFFTAVGIGAGLRPKDQGIDWSSLAPKIGWLFLADLCLNVYARQSLGFDFFGFIGLSMAVVALLPRNSKGLFWLLTSIAVVLTLRFATRRWLGESAVDSAVVAWITGLEPLAGVSYPLSPWIVFPLIGLMLSHERTFIPRHSLLCLSLVTAVGAALVCGLAVTRGGFNRWGSVNFAYMVFSVVAVTCAWSSSLLMAQLFPKTVGQAGMRGPAAFLVVPIHYLLLEFLEIFTTINQLEGLYGIAAQLAIAVTSIAFCISTAPWVVGTGRRLPPYVILVSALGLISVVVLAGIRGFLGTLLPMAAIIFITTALGRRSR